MSNPEVTQQINTAIGAHGMWKLRLKTAVDSGRGDVSAAGAACDDKCPFGKWLYGPALAPAIREGMPYRVVRRLHAEFHTCAGSVLACVERGDRPGAMTLLGSEFAERSEKLSRALTKWKSELASW